MDRWGLSGGCRSPASGLTAAHRLPDAAAADGAVEILADHFASHTAGIWQLFHPLMDRQPLDVELGERVEAFTLSQEDKEAVVLVWRNGNIVHVLWDLHALDSPERVDAVVDLARAVDERMG